MKIDADGVVLAGGQSRRMGRDKALIQTPRGQTLLAHAFQTLTHTVDGSVWISLPYGSQASTPCELPDEEPNGGPLAGILRALRQSTAAWMAVLATDLPGAEPALFAQLCPSRDLGADAVLPVCETSSVRQPLAGLWSHALARPLHEYLMHGGRRVSDFLDHHHTLWVPVRQESWIINVNTPEEWSAWLKHLQRD